MKYDFFLKMFDTNRTFENAFQDIFKNVIEPLKKIVSLKIFIIKKILLSNNAISITKRDARTSQSFPFPTNAA